LPRTNRWLKGYIVQLETRLFTSMKKLFVCLLCFIGLFCCSCSRKEAQCVDNPAPSVYFWRTVLKFDSSERLFLQEHGIKKLYARFFDVIQDKNQGPIPVGTLAFEDKIPMGIELIPVVYIENDCLKNPEELAEKIVKRVWEMGATNDLTFKELQIDCDWTSGTQSAYFSLLTAVKKELQAHGNCKISVTVRLHQLNMKVPPADYGVLMCYNTGNLRNYDTKQPILDIKDVQPYVKYLGKYKLPLCAAYPIFGWELLFEHQQFRAILHDVNINDTTCYIRRDKDLYVVKRGHSLPSPDPETFGLMLRPGDEIRVTRPTAKEIESVEQMLEKERPSINKQVIIYSLNAKDIKNINNHEIETIYRH
jgi:hypothetical protein